MKECLCGPFFSSYNVGAVESARIRSYASCWVSTLSLGSHGEHTIHCIVSLQVATPECSGLMCTTHSIFGVAVCAHMWWRGGAMGMI